jgi:hypothetical protein
MRKLRFRDNLTVVLNGNPSTQQTSSGQIILKALYINLLGLTIHRYLHASSFNKKGRNSGLFVKTSFN